MAVRALVVAKSVAHGPFSVTEAFAGVTGRALQIGVSTFEGIGRELRVVERFDLERVRPMARVAFADGLAQAELPRMHVTVAAGALARRPPIRGPTATQPVCPRSIVAAVASRLGVRPGERPNGVIDTGRVPSTCRVALRTAALAHLCSELVPVRIFVAVDATLPRELEVVTWTFASMAARARNSLMQPLQRKLGAAVLLHRERGRPKATFIVAGGAVRVAEGAAVHVTVAVPTPIELEPAVPTLDRELRGMAPVA
jgi:hypothetical protein